MASWWNKWKKNEEDEQSIRDKLATLGTPCVIEKNKVDNSSRNLTSEIKSENNNSLVVTVKSFDERLKLAMIEENGDEIKYCIENGANPNIIYNGTSLLFYMVFSNNLKMVELCLKHGSIATTKNLSYIDNFEIEGDFDRTAFNYYSGKTPIELAIYKDYIDILHLFLEYKIKDETLRKWVNKRLLISILEKNINNIEYYMNNAANIYEYVYVSSSTYGLSDPYYEKLKNYNSSPALKLILAKKDVNIIKSIMKYDSSSSDLYEWFSRQEENIIDEFIRYGVDIIDMIAHSIIKNNVRIINLLNKYNFDLYKKFIGQNEYKYGKGNSILLLTVNYDRIEILKELLKKGVNINSDIVIHSACRNQNFSILKLLVENGADVNLKGYEGRTALFNAIEATKANKDIIKYLIQNGANIYQEDDKGITPLSFAESSKKSMVKVLLESIPIELKIEKNFNSDDKSISNDNKFNEQIIEQNKVINRLQKEIKNMVPPSKMDELNSIIETQSQNIQNLEKYLQLQLDEINNIKKEFINNQTNQTQYINELVQKIKKLEKENQKNRNIKKQKVSLNIPIQLENKTINQNDAILVKRESFDDF